MSFFSKKQEVNLEDFCRNFYDNMILNPKIGDMGVDDVFPNYVKESIAEVEPEFANIDLQKLAAELIIMRFELFALAWQHSFGELAIDQSIFTKNYLHEKGRDDIWEGMEHYNKAISHSVTVELSELNKACIYKMRVDLGHKYIDIAKKNGIDLDKDTAYLESIGRPINRISSEKVWKKRITPYFLMLGLCHKLGLGYGKDYYGPNKEAQFRLVVFIRGLYDGAQQSWEDVKIIN